MLVLGYFPALKWDYTEGTFVVCYAHKNIEYVSVHEVTAHTLISKSKI